MKYKRKDFGLADNMENDDSKAHKPQPTIDYQKAFHTPHHPLAKRLFRKLKNVLNIPVVYKQTTTLGDMLMKRRPPPDFWKKMGAICSIPCENPGHRYIGQTQSSLLE